ncbi:uncharacterized protein LOC126901483 isoform X2 [Daktulosphaira vitifoliae]|uniref:uncharacterized protein LOC126901483 isoform X2 n=1 Tax=Daktulosphaira vitifoliae TaxID=58002 RepID=UPI0021A9D13F|nr:uncharacterized protein LOC126901483 isoform X2 [Daktulosphaira vitifoliae]
MTLSAAPCFLAAVAFGLCVSAGDPVIDNNNTFSNLPAATTNSDFNNVSESPAITIFNSSSTERDSRFLNVAPDSGDSNLIQEKQDEATLDPGSHLVGIYTDCLLQWSFPCVQRKLLLFLDNIGKMKGFSVLGDILSVVRIKRDMKPPINETELMARLNNVDEQNAMSALMEHAMDKFISNHVIRVTLPAGITAALNGGQGRSMIGNTLDINMSRALGEGRGKKKNKKMMHMMMMGLMAKMAVMGPLMMMLIKLKAIKALILSKLALLLSLGSLMKGKKSGGSSGAGAAGGWGGVNSQSGGWGRKSVVHEPHWVAYRAYIPTNEDDNASKK